MRYSFSKIVSFINYKYLHNSNIHHFDRIRYIFIISMFSSGLKAKLHIIMHIEFV